MAGKKTSTRSAGTEGTITAYALASRGVVVDTSDVHASDADLLVAQNVQVDAVGGRGSIRRRDGFLALNAVALAGPVLGGIGVPLVDRSQQTRVFYLACNDGISSFLTSPDGAVWTAVTTPARPVREATLGVDNGLPYGDAAMRWQGVGDRLYYPGDDYSQDGVALPSLHAWNGADDVVVAYIPTNPLDAGNTSGAFGITSILSYDASRLLLAVADRNSSGQGRSRVLLLDTRSGALKQLGSGGPLNTGQIVGGLIVWQGRVWVCGINHVSTGGALTTLSINPEAPDADWVVDDAFGTQHGYCTGLCVFKGELYQSSAAEAGQHALIRRRVPTAAGSATVTTAVAVGNTSVQGGTTIVQGGSTTVQIGGATTLDVRNTQVASGGYTAGTTSINVNDASMFSTGGGGGQYSAPGGANLLFNYTGKTGNTLTGLSMGGFGPGIMHTLPAGTYIQNVVLVGTTPIPVLDTAAFPSSAGTVLLQGLYALAYTGRSTASGPGELTGVSGGAGTLYFLSSGIAAVPALPVGSTDIPVVDTAVFLASVGGATIGSNSIVFTGRSTASGPGVLTGVTGVTVAIAAGATVTVTVPAGATQLPVADLASFPATGSADVAGQLIAYTGKSTASGPGALTGVTGLGSAAAIGATVTVALAVGATVVPVADTTNFLPAGAATVGPNSITYTAVSTPSGPGNLTGVSGIATAVLSGAAVVAGSVPIAAAYLPLVDTSGFADAGGSATAAGQSLTYTGRSTTSGRGFLTGVSGITPAIADGAVVSATMASVAVWTTVLTATGTAAGNYLGPMIVTQDADRLLVFESSESVLKIRSTVDGTVWDAGIDVSLPGGYQRAGLPILDDNGDIYWPLATAPGTAFGGLLKRTADGTWSTLFASRTDIRGPIGILRG